MGIFKFSLISVCFTSLISINVLNAGLVNGISVIVENEPITLYDVYDISDRFKISTKKALDFLVGKKLEEARIKNLGIDVSDYEVNTRLEYVATQNSLSAREFKKFLSSNGVDVEEYLREIKQKLKQEKLYKIIFAEKLNFTTEEEIKKYYEAKKDEFKIANNFKVVKYSSHAGYILEQKIKDPLRVVEGVRVSEEVLDKSQLNPKLLNMLNSLKPGNFTSIIETKEGFFAYSLIEKTNFSIIPFESAKRQISEKIENEKRQVALHDYIEKLKVKSNIKILRLPE